MDVLFKEESKGIARLRTFIQVGIRQFAADFFDDLNVFEVY